DDQPGTRSKIPQENLARELTRNIDKLLHPHSGPTVDHIHPLRRNTREPGSCANERSGDGCHSVGIHASANSRFQHRTQASVPVFRFGGGDRAPSTLERFNDPTVICEVPRSMVFGLVDALLPCLCAFWFKHRKTSANI